MKIILTFLLLHTCRKINKNVLFYVIFLTKLLLIHLTSEKYYALKR